MLTLKHPLFMLRELIRLDVYSRNERKVINSDPNTQKLQISKNNLLIKKIELIFLNPCKKHFWTRISNLKKTPGSAKKILINMVNIKILKIIKCFF